MNRRDFTQALGISAVLSTLAGLAPPAVLAQQSRYMGTVAPFPSVQPFPILAL